MTRPRYLALGAALAVAACSDPTSTVRDQLNLDRPVDVAFACYGGLRLSGGDAADPADVVIESAMPAEACATRSLPDDNIPLGQEILSLGTDPSAVNGYGFILQSVPGTVGIARFPNKPSAEYAASEATVIDADLLTPGKNGITVGSLPVAIATDTLGCHLITANAGSCDLSVLSVNSVLARTPAPEINRVPVVSGTGIEILAKPAAMLAEPPSGTIGVECPLTPTGLLYIAYPACHLVASVDGGGHVVEGIQFATDGTATVVGADVTCPAECGDMRDAPTAGPHPTTLDLLVDPRSGIRRLAIGAEDDPTITVVDLDTTDRFTTIEQVPLAGDIGILDVSLSPEIGMGGVLGMRNDDTGAGGQFQFVYAVATDGTVRVADVLNQDRECDAQIDPRFIHDENNIGRLSCLPVGDPLLPRRAGARGPGIQLLGDSVPISVRIFGVDLKDPNAAAGPNALVGYFAAVGTSGGGVVIVNIDDDNYADTEDSTDPLKVDTTLAIAHQIRDAIPGRDLLATVIDPQTNTSVPICDTNGPQFDDPTLDSGGPRLAEPPTRFLNTAFIGSTKGYALPALRSLRCEGHDATMAVPELGFAAPPDVREAAYPDLHAVRKDEQWSLVWEGSLSRDTENSDVDGPPVRIGQFKVDGTGMRVEDPSHPFCSMGVEPHDIVAMRGCDPNLGDAQCPTGYSCYVHPDSQLSSGSCLPTDKIDTLSGPCRDFLVSSRRFSVRATRSGELKLAERPRVLRTSPLSGCTSAAQCDDLYIAETRLKSDLDPGMDTTTPDPRSWACEPDTTRNDPTRPRCVMTCDPAGDSSDCDAGAVCNATGRCVEGIVPPLQCVESLQRFEVRASEAFSVVGTSAGFQHSIIEDAGGACVKDPAGNPLLVGRIPLTAPPCLGDGLTDLSPNPCQTTIDHTYLKPRYTAGTCDLANPSDELVTEPTTAIRFRNPQMTYHLVNATYPGDLMCKGDRLGGLDLPTVFPGMTIQFEQVDGLAPKAAQISSTFPVRIVGGPQNSLWIIDEGDFLSTSASSASTRGKVFRIEAIDLSVINTLQ